MPTLILWMHVLAAARAAPPAHMQGRRRARTEARARARGAPLPFLRLGRQNARRRCRMHPKRSRGLLCQSECSLAENAIFSRRAQVLDEDVHGGFVQVELLRGESLAAMDKRGTSDPYVVICLPGATHQGARHKTKTKKKTLAPQWTREDKADNSFVRCRPGQGYLTKTIPSPPLPLPAS